MKAHTSNYKKALIGARQIKQEITYIEEGETKTYDEDNLVMVKPITNADLLKSVMKELDIESKTPLEKNQTIHFRNGLKVGSSYEYMDYGEYIVYEVEYRADTKTYYHICYDKMLLTMIPYEPLDITYPIWVREYIYEIAKKCGLNFIKTNFRFGNYNVNITKDYFVDGNYTYRDILDYLSEIVGGWIIIDNLGNLNIKYPTETEEVFNNDFLNQINVDFNKKYGPVNSIVFARANETDNIEYNDEESIRRNGLCSIKITDNPFLSGEDRENFMSHGAWWTYVEHLMGLEFYLCDVENKGITYLELGDYFDYVLTDTEIKALKSGLVKSGLRKAQSGGDKYKCLLINDETTFTNGINEKIYTEEPLETNEEYITTIPSNNSLKNAQIIANKNAGEIVLKANSDGKVVQARLDADANEGSLFEVKADNIKLEGYTTINGNFTIDEDGDMSCNDATINGNLVTANGVLTNLVFPCEIWGWTKENVYDKQGGWLVGFNYTYTEGVNKSFLNFTVRIPENFTVTSAKITLRHSPMAWIGDDTQYGSCKNMRAYITEDLGTLGTGAYNSFLYIGGNTPTFTQINAVSSHNFSDSDFQEYTTENFASEFTHSGTYNISYMTTTEKPTDVTSSNAYQKCGQHTGILNGWLEVIGYMKYTPTQNRNIEIEEEPMRNLLNEEETPSEPNEEVER